MWYIIRARTCGRSKPVQSQGPLLGLITQLSGRALHPALVSELSCNWFEKQQSDYSIVLHCHNTQYHIYLHVLASSHAAATGH